MNVKLLSHTSHPLETLWCLWEASRHDKDVPPPSQVALMCKSSTGWREKVEDLATRIIDSAIPVAENVSFVFLLEGVSISFREQMVRHRIGSKVGERLGMDMAPGLHDSTWWSQSMRILPMGAFASEGKFRTPQGLTKSQKQSWNLHMKEVQDMYNYLLDQGIPAEEARDVIPLAATHRISWTLNLAALKHIIGKRGCWILQAGLWEPVIRGMVEALTKDVHPLFRRLIDPPCIRNDKFDTCKVKLDNERRLEGEDPLPPCSLWLWQEQRSDDPKVQAAKQSREVQKYEIRYGELWQRNPRNGVRKS